MTPPEVPPPETPAEKPPAQRPPAQKPPAKKPPAKKPAAKATSAKAPPPVETRPTAEIPAPAPASAAVEMPPPEGTLPVNEPSPTEPAAKKGRFGLGTAAIISLVALGGGVAFGAFLSVLLGGPPAPSPSPSPSPSDAAPSPTVFVETTRLTIPEGFSAADVYERASETLGIPIEDFEAAAADPSAIGLPTEANGSVEGWLGPYTYHIPETATAVDVLAEMVDGQLLHLDRLGVSPQDRLDVLTRASLIEKEVNRDEDRPKVARVIQNRLDQNWPLQFDSTFHYAASLTGETLTEAEQRTLDSPYNTYRYIGLPPGPICSPGDEAMQAVLSPADGTWMFFVTVNLDTGETRFATTLEEHNANVELLREWQAANP